MKKSCLCNVLEINGIQKHGFMSVFNLKYVNRLRVLLISVISSVLNVVFRASKQSITKITLKIVTFLNENVTI